MEKRLSYLARFEQIIAERNFEVLVEFEDERTWLQLSTQERELLALLFVWRGGNQVDRKNFALARLLAPESVRVRYWEGMAWLKGEQELQAAMSFEEVTCLDPDFPPAWHAWAVAKSRLNTLDDLEESEAHFLTAEGLFQKKEDLGQLYWDWASSRCAMGRLSGEAIDYRSALEKFSQAEALEIDRPSFWLDYGDTYVSLSKLVGDLPLLERALRCFVKVVQHVRDSYEGWMALGRTFKRLYLVSSTEEHYIRAVDCFERAIQVSRDETIWIEWADLLIEAGPRRDGAPSFELALEKLKHVEGRQEIVLALRLRALVRLGATTERLEILQEAEKLALEAVSHYPTAAFLWCRLGEVFAALGHYFSDEDYYRRAAKQFNTALTFDEELIDAQFALAESCFSLGTLRSDRSLFEKAAQRCQLIISRDPLHSEGWSLWGVALGRLAEFGDRREILVEAVEKLTRAIDLRGGLGGNVEPDWLFNTACALDCLGALDGDEEVLRQSLGILSRMVNTDPEDSGARLQLALVWLHLADLSSDVDAYHHACECFQAVVVRDPDDEAVWDEWGCALLSLSRLIDDPANREEGKRLREEAESKFLRAVGLGCTEALYHLAQLHAQSKQADRATDFLRRAQKEGTLPPLEAVLHDDWLTPLREDADFRRFLDEAGGE